MTFYNAVVEADQTKISFIIFPRFFFHKSWIRRSYKFYDFLFWNFIILNHKKNCKDIKIRIRNETHIFPTMSNLCCCWFAFNFFFFTYFFTNNFSSHLLLVSHCNFIFWYQNGILNGAWDLKKLIWNGK